MPAVQGRFRFDVITRQWHDLANRRLAYFTELYRSGRWQRYYSEQHFALRMLDVIKAERAWRDLAGRSWSKQSARHDDDLRHAA